MKKLKNEFKRWLVSVFIEWAFDLCPDGEFKLQFAIFINQNIMKL